MGKLLVLGFDALEYDFVVKWNLTNLLQNQCSKIGVPIDEKIGKPISGPVWASFLTGKARTDKWFFRNYKKAPTLKHGLKNKVITTLLFLKPYIPRKLRRRALSMHVGMFYPDYLAERTFLDETNSKAINVPFYNYDYKEFYLMERSIKLLRKDEIDTEEVVCRIEDLWRERKIQLVNELEDVDEYDVVFFFHNCLDQLQHFAYRNLYRIHKMYVDMDSFVGVLKHMLNDWDILIISDHGFDLQTKTHSLYGFFSSSATLNPKPTHITDLFGHICDR
ncbi:MAG: alkaline phosphatase family protein [Candidatus Bathyarchaeota archaeon]|nr:MAG: alkaline phosphatase family protein [Candidatus Bathyarchaeota archaeon]